MSSCDQFAYKNACYIGRVPFIDYFTLAEWVSPMISHWRSGFHRLFHIGGVGFTDYFTLAEWISPIISHLEARFTLNCNTRLKMVAEKKEFVLIIERTQSSI